jgi:hypothetical protein
MADLFGVEDDTTGKKAKFILDWWCKTFAHVEGKPYHVSGAKDMKLLKTLVKERGFEDLMLCADQFFRDQNNTLIQKGGRTIGIFSATINAYPKDTSQLKSNGRSINGTDITETLRIASRLTQGG